MTKADQDHLSTLAERAAQLVIEAAHGIRANDLFDRLMKEEKNEKRVSTAIRLALDNHQITLGPEMVLVKNAREAA